MDAKKFVTNWKKEKESTLIEYLDSKSDSDVAQKIVALKLDPQQRIKFAELLDSILTDLFYSLLLGLDGSSSIGGEQHEFKIFNEKNESLSECGDLEVEAWEQFHQS